MPQPLNRLTAERSAIIILFLLVFAMASRISVDTDMWWHLRSGQYIAESGQFIYPDPFSHTFTDVVHLNHSALSDGAMFAIWQLFGFAGISVATAILAVAGMLFVFLTSRGSAYPRAFLLVLGAATAAVFWSPRPQMFSFLFASVLLWILRDLKTNRHARLLWILPLQLIWCNTHGGFIIGYLMITVFVLGESLNSVLGTGERCLSPMLIRKLVLLSVASIPLLVLNPLGIRVYGVPFSTIAMPELGRYIQEWQPPDFGLPHTWSFILLLALVLAAIRFSERKFDWTEWILLCGSAAMGLLAARNLALFAILAVPVACRSSGRHLATKKVDHTISRHRNTKARRREPVPNNLGNKWCCIALATSVFNRNHECGSDVCVTGRCGETVGFHGTRRQYVQQLQLGRLSHVSRPAASRVHRRTQRSLPVVSY